LLLLLQSAKDSTSSLCVEYLDESVHAADAAWRSGAGCVVSRHQYVEAWSAGNNREMQAESAVETVFLLPFDTGNLE